MADELAPYESAARSYCKKAGLNPDEFKDVPHPSVKNITTRIYRWQAVAEELIDLSWKLTALKEASGYPYAVTKKQN